MSDDTEKDWEKVIKEQEAADKKAKDNLESADSEEQDKDLWDTALAEQNVADSEILQKPIPSRVADIHDSGSELNSIEMEQVSAELANGFPMMDKNILSDIPLTFEVMVGKTQVRIRDLLRYTQGSIVELDTSQDSPFVAMVAGRVIAKGDIVVINNKFGIRLTEIVTPKERLESKKELV